MRRHPQQQEGCSEKAQVEQGAAAVGPAALPECWTVQPILMSYGDGRMVACHDPF
jgi:hypothetical protein